jgi:hypothetical protein
VLELLSFGPVVQHVWLYQWMRYPHHFCFYILYKKSRSFLVQLGFGIKHVTFLSSNENPVSETNTLVVSYCRCTNTKIWGSVGPPLLHLWGRANTLFLAGIWIIRAHIWERVYTGSDHVEANKICVWMAILCHTRFLRSKPDAHRMYAQDQVVIHTVRM